MPSIDIWVNPTSREYMLLNITAVYVANKNGNKHTGPLHEKKDIFLGFKGYVYEPGEEYMRMWQFYVDKKTIFGRSVKAKNGAWRARSKRNKRGRWLDVTKWVPKEAIGIAGGQL